MVSSTELTEAVRSKIPNISSLVVSDVSGGCGQAYDIIIVSDAFEGLSTLKRHRMVNELLKPEIEKLHAFSQKTYTKKQYAALNTPSEDSSSQAAPTISTSAADSAPNPPHAVAVPNNDKSMKYLSTLDTTSPVRSKSSSGSHHRTRSSNISVPELTLTTDADAGLDAMVDGPSPGAGGPGGAGDAASGSGPGTPVRPTQTLGRARSGSSVNSPRSSTTSQLPDYDTNLTSSAPISPNLSKLQYSKITSPAFWESLYDFLHDHLAGDPADASPLIGATSNSTTNTSAIPTTPTSPSSSSRRKLGEPEAERLWEDFFLSQKHHLSATDVARIRDSTGRFGQGGV